MRMLQYKLPLVEMGYLVASGEIHNSEEAYPEECLPIKMTLLRYDADYLLGCVIDVITRSNGFRAYYKEALLGKLPNNYLYSFEVQPDSLVLGYTDGTIVLGAGPSQLKLQFDVPHRSGKADTKYTVSLNNDTDLKSKQPRYSARVHEFIGDIHRDIYFEQIGEKRDYNNHYVYIDEYIDP